MKCMGNDGVEDLRLIRHHAVATTQNGWVKMWKKSCRTRRISLWKKKKKKKKNVYLAK